MTPVVSVWSRPNGLPIASTFWPTCRSAEVPIMIFDSFDGGASILITARSLSRAVPMILPS